MDGGFASLLVAAGSAALTRAAQQWARGDAWTCFAVIDGVQTSGDHWSGETLFVPARGAGSVLLLLGNQLAVLSTQQPPPGLHVEALPSLGLRGAGLARLRLDNLKLPDERAAVDHDRILRAWHVLSAADLTSIGYGMADQLCERTIAHATNRVQFPGLFLDEQSRDTIGKFGAVKKMVAEMAARRLVLQTLDHVLSPADFSAPSATQMGMVKLVVAEALGTTAEFVQKYPNTARALVAAILDASRYIDTMSNRSEVARIISSKSYVNTEFDVIEDRMLGQYDNGLGKKWQDKNYMKFFNDGTVNFPYLSDGMWFMTQHRRWGLLKEDPDYLAVAKKVNRIDVYKDAATMTNTPLPKSDMRSSKLIDGVVWDGKSPKAYADGFKIKV